MKILIINGPNLNLLGTREVGVYGDISFEEYFKNLQAEFNQIELDYFQSNVEGEIINEIQRAEGIYGGIIMNAGGYSHTSVAIADAIRAVDVPVVEVHISNIHARETYRQHSITAAAAKGVIAGFGLHSYRMALQVFVKKII